MQSELRWAVAARRSLARHAATHARVLAAVRGGAVEAATTARDAAMQASLHAGEVGGGCGVDIDQGTGSFWGEDPYKAHA